MRPRAILLRSRLAGTVVALLLSFALASPARAEFGEVGWNDYRVSYGDPDRDDRAPAVAYSPLHDVYLVVWREQLQHPNDPNPRRIVARRLEGSTGRPLGDEIEVLDFADCSGPFCPSNPAVTYSPTVERFVVAVALDAFTIGQAVDEFEIVAWDVDPETGASSWLQLLSGAGGLGDPDFDALDPALACSSDTTQCLVAWWGDDDVGGLIDSESEIFGQRLNAATGTAQGANDFRISDLGGTGNTAFDAGQPDVAYNGATGEYLVVWHGDDDTGGLVDEEGEIFAQRLDAATGAEEGTNDLRVSDMGGTGNPDFDAGFADLAYDAAAQQYLVVWHGDDDEGELQDGESEIFGQRLAGGSAAEVGANDLQLSDLGGTGSNPFDASFPAVAYASASAQLLVVWEGNDDVGGLAEFEVEVLAQRLGEQVVFTDGFGSGDTAAWSLTVP